MALFWAQLSLAFIMSKFADDAKLCIEVNVKNDVSLLQKDCDLDRLHAWSQTANVFQFGEIQSCSI